eukprot:TRINITY_DN13575_c0_g2_i2.p1 TRINITY_DN13575_c0_g2~~TRINITY_DN13575_c0_g2_i2.p1  ORF type:complete len:280 (-),score=27.40 TRINITY_DN13575_c0_g2_i2:24-863(-)
MISSTKRLIVTGCNRGIGHGIIKKLCSEKRAMDIIFTTRDSAAGAKVLEEFQQEFPEMKDRLYLGTLDISSSESIDGFVQWISTKFGKVDILVNNAAILWRGDDLTEEIVRTTFQTNFYGTIELTEKLLPYLNDSGKVVMISSALGKFHRIGDQKVVEMLDSPDITIETIYDYAKEIYNQVIENRVKMDTRDRLAYALSKLLLSLWVRAYVKKPEITTRNIQIYACCPGWVRTDMGGPHAHKSIEEGTVCPLYLVDLPHEINPELQGKFFLESKVTSLY